MELKTSLMKRDKNGIKNINEKETKFYSNSS